MYSHCTTGGWISATPSTVRAESSAFLTPTQASIPFLDGADEEALVMLSDILPTGFGCGVLNGKVAPGSAVAIVGSGPIGLAGLLTAQFYSPAEIIMIDLDDNRLAVAKRFGATSTVNSADGKAVEKIMKMTGKRGVDTAIEAVGIPTTFELCQKIVTAGGTSLISECMEKRSISISRNYGIAIFPLQRGWSIRSQSRCYSKPWLRKRSTPSCSSRIASSSIRSRCLRDLRQRRQDQSAQGDHRGLSALRQYSSGPSRADQF